MYLSILFRKAIFFHVFIGENNYGRIKKNIELMKDNSDVITGIKIKTINVSIFEARKNTHDENDNALNVLQRKFIKENFLNSNNEL